MLYLELFSVLQDTEFCGPYHLDETQSHFVQFERKHSNFLSTLNFLIISEQLNLPRQENLGMVETEVVWNFDPLICFKTGLNENHSYVEAGQNHILEKKTEKRKWAVWSEFHFIFLSNFNFHLAAQVIFRLYYDCCCWWNTYHFQESQLWFRSSSINSLFELFCWQ